MTLAEPPAAPEAATESLPIARTAPAGGRYGDLLLGIDCGSTVTKAALFGLNGREVASRSSRTVTIAHPNGGVERSAAGYWASVVEAVRGLMSDTGIEPGSIIAIGCAGHGNGLYALDARGRVLATGYQSLDSRAEAIVLEWQEQGLASSYFQDAWQQLWPGQPLPLLEWLRRHDPDVYAAIRSVLMCKDLVNYRLTGRAVSDFTDMSAAGLLINAESTYNRGLLASLGLADAIPMLPELVSSTEIIGGLSPEAADELGLVTHTPVAGGMFDVASSAIGSGGAADGYLSLVAGTWSIATAVTRQPLIDRALLMTTLFADTTRWMAIEASATSASNLDWFASEAFVDDMGATGEGTVVDRCCRTAESASFGPSSPIYHPFLYGSPTRPHAKAGFYGIAGNHTRADLARAVLEGVAFSLRSHVNGLLEAGASATKARLTGGGARSGFWSQMFADVLGVPVEIPDADETGARGAALAAGVGIGVYRDLDAAMDAAAGMVRRHAPDLTLAQTYEQRFAIYRALVDAMDPTWRTLDKSPR